jgi:hypothetical protein
MRNLPDLVDSSLAHGLTAICEELTFNYKDEQILFYFSQYLDEMVTSFNDFPRPEFCKIKQLSKSKYKMYQEE